MFVSVARQSGSENGYSTQFVRHSPHIIAGLAGRAGETLGPGALLELLAAAARAGIVAPHTLERVNKRQTRVGIGQTGVLRAGGPAVLILLGRIREGVPARELANGILQRPDLVILKARHALGIGQSSLQIPAKVIVAHHHGVDQATPERLADNTG